MVKMQMIETTQDFLDILKQNKKFVTFFSATW